MSLSYDTQPYWVLEDTQLQDTQLEGGGDAAAGPTQEETQEERQRRDTRWWH